MHMRILMIILVMVLPITVLARPVSYPNGIMPMAEHSHHGTMANVTYSPTARVAVGVQSEYRRLEESWFNGAIVNWLPYRKNMRESQANLYVRTGLGQTHSHGKDDVGGFAGINADWESRRYLVAYENRYFADSGVGESEFDERVRLGVAPYKAPFEAWHPWFILQFDHTPEDEDNITVTPMLRMFKGNILGEAGISHRGDLYTSLTLQF